MATKAEEKTLYCSFCAKSQHEVKKLIAGPAVYICNECIEQCNDIIADEVASDKTTPRKSELPTPGELMCHLDQYVIGQIEAKKTLANAVHQHYLRVNNKGKTGGVEIAKSNILLIGPTGSGKTFIVRTLARMLNVPFAIQDATTLTQAGFVGEDVENMLVKLLQSADGDVERAQRGIVYLDEGDKLTRARNGTGMSTQGSLGEGVQQALLPILEGTIANLPPVGGRKRPDQEFIQLDTTNILFIVGGAFSGLDDVIKKRLSKGSSIGFGAQVYSEQEIKALDLTVETSDLITFGFIPEFVGRLPVIAPLHELTEGDLVRILKEPNDALCKQYAAIAKLMSVELEFEEDACVAIARRALKKATGARGLRTIIESALKETFFTLPDIQKGKRKIRKITIGADTVEKGTPPRLIYVDGSTS